MTRDDPLLLHDILEALKWVQDYVQGMSRLQFVSNKLVQDAVIRNLEIVGEAAGATEFRGP